MQQRSHLKTNTSVVYFLDKAARNAHGQRAIRIKTETDFG